jgi:hypothetical protein
MIIHPREIESAEDFLKKFSICTLVTNKKEYKEMLQSFYKAGFNETTCEYLYIDNTGKNKLDAYAGIRKFLTYAKGKYIILCHQDIYLDKDNYQKLKNYIEFMNQNHPDWGILGNAGGMNIKKNVYKISYPDGTVADDKPFPRKVKTLDENFLIIRRDANIGISSDLEGFHLYGTDMCLIASTMGYGCYVIDFLLTHKSHGNPDKSFYDLKRALIRKYQKAFSGRYLRTTITILYLSGSRFRSFVFNLKPVVALSKFLFKVRNRDNLS